MASATAPMHALPTRSAVTDKSSDARHLPHYVAPAVAAAIGAAAALGTTWWIVATQTLTMSF